MWKINVSHAATRIAIPLSMLLTLSPSCTESQPMPSVPEDTRNAAGEGQCSGDRRYAVVDGRLVDCHSTSQQQSTVAERRDRFRLFHDCEPMRLVVEELPSGAATIGLTEERIRTLAESRLRAARLFSDDAVPYLYVNVNVAGRGFSTSVEYQKRLYDYRSSQRFLATTWDRGRAGTTGDAGFILQLLSEDLDLFLLQYLRVNEASCDTAR